MSNSISFAYVILIFYWRVGFLILCSLFVQHELGLAADEGVRQIVEQSEGEVSPADKAAAMKAAIEKRVVALRMKMGKLVAVANPKLTDGWFREVRTQHLFPYQSILLIQVNKTE
jgi:hypothetical protein